MIKDATGHGHVRLHLRGADPTRRTYVRVIEAIGGIRIKSRLPHKTPSDHLALLSEESKTWYEYLIAAAPKGSVMNMTWKNDIFSEHDIRDIINMFVLDGCVQHVQEIQKDWKRVSSKRMYIGPRKERLLR